MRRPALLLALVVLILPVATYAQSSAFGVTLGSGESLKDPLDFSFGDSVYQVYYESSFGSGSIFKAQYGTFDTDYVLPDEEGTIVRSEVEYFDLITRYEFDEVYGRSSLFGGLGLYRNKVKDLDDQKDWGLVLGIDATFPVSRNLALTAEIAYHWADFDQNLSVLMVSGGAKVRF